MNCFSSPFAFFWVIRVAVFSPEKLVENTCESEELLKQNKEGANGEIIGANC